MAIAHLVIPLTLSLWLGISISVYRGLWSLSLIQLVMQPPSFYCVRRKGWITINRYAIGNHSRLLGPP